MPLEQALTDEARAVLAGRVVAKPVSLFRAPVLEWLTRGHPAFVFVILPPIIAYAVDRSALDRETALHVAAGVASWVVFEYLLHRFAFHFKATTEGARALAFALHGHHHHCPHDTRRIAAPPIALLSTLAAFSGVASLLLAPFAFLVGALGATLFYEAVHYLIHFDEGPRLSRIRAHHLAHHRDPASRFGVSSPLVDFALRTNGASPTPD